MDKKQKDKLFKIKLLFVVICSFSSSNEENLEQKIQGSWVINKMTYLNQPCIDAFLVNMINIEEGTMIVPVRRGYEGRKGMDSAYWTFQKRDAIYEITIQSYDPLFNRTFVVTYDHKDKSEIAEMTLMSDSVFISFLKTPGIE